MDPYQVLGLPPTADIPEAEDAYHRLLRIHHPDLHQGASADELAAAEHRTRALNSAIRLIRHGYQAAGPDRSARDSAYSVPDEGRGYSDTGVYWGNDDWTTWSNDSARSAPEDRPRVHCPSCGTELHTTAAFRAHMEAIHEMRVGRRPRRRRLRRPSLPLAVLAPANAMVALAVMAVVNNHLHDTQIATWAALVVMGPSVVRVFGGTD